MPDISVIVPVYNMEKYLRQCLNSILTQQGADFEVICINDGSTDASEEILREYAQKYLCLRYYTQPNRGLGAARNEGCRRAEGKYMIFVDSDDFLAPGYFAEAVRLLESTGAEVAMFNPVIYDARTGQTHPYRSMLEFYRFSRLGAFPIEEHPLLLSYNGCWDKVYRRDLLEKNGIVFPSPRIYEDVTYGIFSQVCAKSVCVAKEGYYYYRKNTGTSITDRELNNKKFRADFLQNLREVRDFLRARRCGESIWSGVMLYALRDGMFHLCYTRPHRDFVAFFRSLREIFTEEEFRTVLAWNAEKINWFAETLIENDVRTCKKRIVSYLNQPLTL